MIQTSDVVAAVAMLLSLSPGCVIPEIVFERPGGGSLDVVTRAGRRERGRPSTRRPRVRVSA